MKKILFVLALSLLCFSAKAVEYQPGLPGNNPDDPPIVIVDPPNPGDFGSTACPASWTSCFSCWQEMGLISCTRCNSGYYLSGGSCYACPANATCNGIGIICNTGYTLSGSLCVAQLPANCATGSGTTCTKCNSGYYLSVGACSVCPSKATCDGIGITCKDGYQLAGNVCVPVDTTPVPDTLPENCYEVSEKDPESCIKCFENHILVNGKCFKDAPTEKGNTATCKSPLKPAYDDCCCTL